MQNTVENPPPSFAPREGEQDIDLSPSDLILGQHRR